MGSIRIQIYVVNIMLQNMCIRLILGNIIPRIDEWQTVIPKWLGQSIIHIDSWAIGYFIFFYLFTSKILVVKLTNLRT